MGRSGWVECPSIAGAVVASGLPAITRDSLESMFSDAEWELAERYTAELRERFASARFGQECEWGVVLVPDPARLDTRLPADRSVRVDQRHVTRPDVFDDRLGSGVLSVSAGRAWTMVVTVTGPAGVALGSYDAIEALPVEACEVAGVDVRAAMSRQLWGARVLQRGSEPPDCEHNTAWTFTVHAAEPLVEGLCESGTVLKGAVRFRLGKPDRGISSARASPGIVVIAD